MTLLNKHEIFALLGVMVFIVVIIMLSIIFYITGKCYCCRTHIFCRQLEIKFLEWEISITKRIQDFFEKNTNK